MAFISEQAAVACGIADVADILSQDAERWLAPFVQLACHEGNAAGVALRRSFGLSEQQRDPGLRSVTIRLGDLERVQGAAVGTALDVIIGGYPALFSSFSGRLVLLPASTTLTVLELSGVFETERPKSDPLEVMIDQRAALTCITRLLENLRVGFEELVRAENGSP